MVRAMARNQELTEMSGIICGNPQVLEDVMTLGNTAQLNKFLTVVFVSFFGLIGNIGNDESVVSCLWSVVCLMPCAAPFAICSSEAERLDG